MAIQRVGGGNGSHPPAYYTYLGSDGRELFRKKRYYFDGKKQFAMEHKQGGEYVKGRGGKAALYRLPELLEALKANKAVIVCEGEKDADTFKSWGMTATTNDTGAGNWKLEHSQHFPRDAQVYICGDADVPGQQHVHQVGQALVGQGCRVFVVDLGYPIQQKHGRDISDWKAERHTKEDFTELAKRATPFAEWQEPDPAKHPAEHGAANQPEDKQPKPKQADIAIQLARNVELFHDEDRAYARIGVEGHQENWRLRGREFKTWLRRQFFLSTETAIGSQALDDALGVLEGKALFEGPQIKTHVRIAGDDAGIYVDLGNAAWQVLEVTSEGWKVLDESPIRFRRPPGMGELPVPVSGGRLDTDLEPFLNMHPDDRKLFIACLVNAFRPVGPYPVLCLHGEQGSAKSTAARIFRACIDPNTAMLRSTPREERDLLIAGSNGWVVAFDNLSHLPAWVSDALCRVATGSGFGVRELYADDAEILFQVQRPVVLNGIEDIANRGDLLDRSVLVNMPPITEKHRLTERSFMEQFKEGLPGILGALLDAVSGAMRNLSTVKLDSVPRMADFCFWVVAAESALGWGSGEFLRIYRANREEANTLALDANPIVPEIIKLLETTKEWVGTATDLHEKLTSQISETKRKSKAWPKTGRMTSASLKRLAPNLRAIGIDVEWDRTKKTRILRLKVESIVSSSPSSPSSPESAPKGDAGDANDAETHGFTLMSKCPPRAD